MLPRMPWNSGWRIGLTGSVLAEWMPACPAPPCNARTQPGRLRLLRLPLSVLLGTTAVPGVHPDRMPILWALANPKIGEREVLAAMLPVEAGVVAEHDGILLISDKGFASTPRSGHRPRRPGRSVGRGRPLL